MKKSETKDRIREAMDIRGFKQTDLVEKTGIDKGQLSSYISGKYKPRQNNLHLIASALNVDEAWLMGFDVPMELKQESYTATPSIDLIPVEIQLLTDFRSLSDFNKVKATKYVHTLAESNRMESELRAAHERTDIEHTAEGKAHDLAIMDDDDEWKE
ncbi:MAG: helix-turn-helix domain-containing protein [Lachnospiraceae bacterium]|nr:helix-turn-helix domain-containing protein [Lachnospiraceae bacterium]